MPLHLLKDQLLDGYASIGPLRQSDPAGAIQPPGELFALFYLRLRRFEIDFFSRLYLIEWKGPLQQHPSLSIRKERKGDTCYESI